MLNRAFNAYAAQSGQDPQEAGNSERAGRERAKEDDPAVHREYDKPEK